MDRRLFLQSIGAAASAALIEGCDAQGPRFAQGLLRRVEERNERVERWLFRPGSRDRVSRDAPLTGRMFPKYFVSERLPVWDGAVRGPWTLDVSGAVRRPARLSLEDLMRLRSVSQRVHHYCVEGWMARAEWTGVRMMDLVRLVEPTPDARYVDFQSFDSGYHESWDLESALHPQTIVAYGMDGRLLGPGHGAPARVHSPIKLGYKCTKYLTRIVFLPERNGGYWSDRGYEWYAGV
jgi:DMSO/TMAO reductase YedYZ molybdopterin-dependent catalytic subunit